MHKRSCAKPPDVAVFYNLFKRRRRWRQPRYQASVQSSFAVGALETEPKKELNQKRRRSSGTVSDNFVPVTCASNPLPSGTTVCSCVFVCVYVCVGEQRWVGEVWRKFLRRDSSDNRDTHPFPTWPSRGSAGFFFLLSFFFVFERDGVCRGDDPAAECRVLELGGRFR